MAKVVLKCQKQIYKEVGPPEFGGDDPAIRAAPRYVMRISAYSIQRDKKKSDLTCAIIRI